MLPDGKAGRRIAFTILGIPGKSGGHHLKLDAVRLQQVTLAVGPGAFDKLDDARFFPMSDSAGDGTKTGRRFSFSVTGEHDNNTAFFLRCRHAGINFVFYPLLAFTVAFITHCAIPGLRPGWASKVIPVLRRLSSPISHK